MALLILPLHIVKCEQLDIGEDDPESGTNHIPLRSCRSCLEEVEFGLSLVPKDLGFGLCFVL